MQREIENIEYENGEIQNVEIISGIDWETLNFEKPSFTKKAFASFVALYRNRLIPSEPDSFGTVVMFHVPSTISNALFNPNTKEGYFLERQSLCAYYGNLLAREKKVYCVDGKLHFENEDISKFFLKLQEEGYLYIEKGNLNSIVFLPVSSNIGFLSELNTKKTICNSHFFLMDYTDKASHYDVYGTPYGLALQKGRVLQAPLFNRDAFLIHKDSSIEIRQLNVIDCSVIIDKIVYEHSKNAQFFYRPQHEITPPINGCDIVIINNEVVAVKKGGNTTIPSSGFVVQVEAELTVTNTSVSYKNFEDYVFGVQVGTTLINNSESITDFTFEFYDNQKGGVVVPPTKYPLNFNTSRAARMGIGQKNGELAIIWIEGSQAMFYRKGIDSCGASLLEFCTLGKKFGFDALVNLDGGGSSQIVSNKKRLLHLADKIPSTLEDAERPTPMGISFAIK